MSSEAANIGSSGLSPKVKVFKFKFLSNRWRFFKGSTINEAQFNNDKSKSLLASVQALEKRQKDAIDINDTNRFLRLINENASLLTDEEVKIATDSVDNDKFPALEHDDGSAAAADDDHFQQDIENSLPSLQKQSEKALQIAVKNMKILRSNESMQPLSAPHYPLEKVGKSPRPSLPTSTTTTTITANATHKKTAKGRRASSTADASASNNFLLIETGRVDKIIAEFSNDGYKEESTMRPHAPRDSIRQAHKQPPNARLCRMFSNSSSTGNDKSRKTGMAEFSGVLP